MSMMQLHPTHIWTVFIQFLMIQIARSQGEDWMLIVGDLPRTPLKEYQLFKYNGTFQQTRDFCVDKQADMFTPRDINENAMAVRLFNRTNLRSPTTGKTYFFAWLGYQYKDGTWKDFNGTKMNFKANAGKIGPPSSGEHLAIKVQEAFSLEEWSKRPDDNLEDHLTVCQRKYIKTTTPRPTMRLTTTPAPARTVRTTPMTTPGRTAETEDTSTSGQKSATTDSRLANCSSVEELNLPGDPTVVVLLVGTGVVLITVYLTKNWGKYRHYVAMARKARRKGPSTSTEESPKAEELHKKIPDVTLSDVIHGLSSKKGGPVYLKAPESVYSKKSESVYSKKGGSVYSKKGGSVYSKKGGSVYSNKLKKQKSRKANSSEDSSISDSSSLPSHESAMGHIDTILRMKKK